MPLMFISSPRSIIQCAYCSCKGLGDVSCVVVLTVRKHVGDKCCSKILVTNHQG